MSELYPPQVHQPNVTPEDKRIVRSVFGDDENLLYETGENIWEELLRRSKDKSFVRAMENVHLVRLADLLARVELAIKRTNPPEPPQTSKTSILDILQTPGLAPERRREILDAARAKLAADLELLDELMNEKALT